MGTFKPLLPVEESTVIERVIDNAGAAGIKEVVVVVGHRAESLLPTLRKKSVAWVVNPAYHGEMFASIKIGVQQFKQTTRAFFLLPGDMPFIRPSTFVKLLRAFDPGKMDLLKPSFHGKSGHPILISTRKISAITSFEESGGLRALIKKQLWQTAELYLDDPGIHADLDTPQDYKKLSAFISSKFY